MFGPHFHVDLVRLARKRWPTLVRVVYLSILLIGLTIMYRSADTLLKSGEFANGRDPTYSYVLSAVADRAQVYAHFLVVLQDILVLLFLPVYVASAIADIAGTIGRRTVSFTITTLASSAPTPRALSTRPQPRAPIVSRGTASNGGLRGICTRTSPTRTC